MIKIEDITPVIVSYYRPERLKICIKSLNLCDNIIVWDNSGDKPDWKDTVEEIKKIDESTENTTFFYTPENLGVPAAFNKGIINSKTDWVLLTVDDMIFDDNWFDVLTDIIKEKPHLEQIHLNSWNAIVIHKKTIARMGWWDERYRIYPSMEDDDWYLRTIEHLGYSPYTAVNENHQFQPEYIQYELWPSIDKVKELHDRVDNFTYYCNSEYSKYPIIGEETISGGSLDAGSRNNFDWSRENKSEEKGMTGVQWHQEKWQYGYFKDVSKTEGFLLAKDGRFWKRKIEDIDFYPEITKEYKKEYDEKN